MAKKRTEKPAAKKTQNKGSTTGRVTRITASDSKASKPVKTKKPAAKKPAVSKKSTKTSNTKTSSRVIDSLRKISLRRKKSATYVNPVDTMEHTPTKNPLRALWRYFRGSWFEINQVRWPDRPTTWQMTGALLAFTAFFVLIIILLDSLFKYLFEFILG